MGQIGSMGRGARVVVLAGWLGAVVSGCRTIPAGAPPVGPVVLPVPAITKLVSAEAAVNLMVTSLATRCPQVGGAGGEPPAMVNSFVVADREVNCLPMEVWQSLIRMRLVRPVLPDDPAAAYRLESTLRREPFSPGETAGDQTIYRWQMRLEQLDGERGRECWQEDLLLAVPANPVTRTPPGVPAEEP